MTNSAEFNTIQHCKASLETTFSGKGDDLEHFIKTKVFLPGGLPSRSDGESIVSWILEIVNLYPYLYHVMVCYFILNGEHNHGILCELATRYLIELNRCNSEGKCHDYRYAIEYGKFGH